MIMYACVLYRSYKVKWIGKVYFPTHTGVGKEAHESI